MPNLQELLPVNSLAIDAIYAYHKQRGDSELQRQYLGMSEIGHICTRFLWYRFRHCCKSEFTGRMYRLFETGQLAETRFANELRAIGCEVYETNELGEQFGFSELGGHFRGHMDGCAIKTPGREKTWVGLEYKTHNEKSFTKLTKEGVEKCKPQHYAQCQCYMASSGLTRFLYLAVNKNDDSLYCEVIRYNKEYAKNLKCKAERIITSPTPPERISDRPDFWQCTYCEAKEICFGIQTPGKAVALPVPAISCRQCCHATPTMDGNAHWKCEKHGRGLSEADQAEACIDHLCLPGLFAYSIPIDYSENHIEFSLLEQTKTNDQLWKHGKGEGCFSTKELMVLSQQQLHIGMIQIAKNLYQAEITEVCHNDILKRYPDSDVAVVWSGRASDLVEIWKRKFDENLESLIPIAISNNFEARAAEYQGGRVAVYYENCKQAEIRRRKE